MGLLDKAGNVGTTPDEKPKAVAKAVAKATPKAVAKATPKAVAKATKASEGTAVSAKPVKVKKVKTPRTTGLPTGFELASTMNRSISWWVNISVNFSVLIIAIAMMINDTNVTTTILVAIAFIVLLFNIIIIPLKTGRTIGHFVSRTKFMTASGKKASVFHSFLANTAGLFALMGLIMVGILWPPEDSKDYISIIFIIIGLIFMVLWIVNGRFKRNSDMDQGLYDLMFSAYLVKHIPAEGEVSTGIWGRLENAGEWGDKIASRREDSIKKSAEKAASKAQKAKEDAKNTSTDSAKNE
jgi:hypothetical protein